MATTTVASSSNEKPYSISQIKAYIPIMLDIKKLNYHVWRELFETHCICFGVFGNLDGTTTPTADTKKEWKEHYGLVNMWIYGTISESILDTVLKTKCSARDLWVTIEVLFRDNKEARSLEIESELRTTVIGDLSVHEYCQKLKSMADLLENLGSPVSDRALVMHLLNGLSAKFDNIINVIKHKSPFPAFTEARSMLSMEEKCLAKTLSATPINTNTASAPALLYTTSTPQQQNHDSSPNNGGYTNNFHGGSPRGTNRGRGRGGRNSRGHGRHNFHWSGYPMQPWQFGAQLWPPPYFQSVPPMFLYPNSPMGSNPHFSTHNNNFQPGLLCSSSARPNTTAHLAYTQHKPQPNTYFPEQITHAFNTMTLQDPSTSPWLMDTGATNHIASTPGSANPEQPSPL
ncbi:PREDICTED: uncharacterized protein LOC104724290 [Camelina sativa]|uniref:Uncharacterized protein LOC104724290 n=1 Tax=Camelina sativa TaxID=90675 RepID=A0ABM0UH30_CAMSA|nr:PREDICTED: uncharacterized protein LOC104724290 [Camelina sativa]